MELDHHLYARLRQRAIDGLTRQRWICDSPQQPIRQLGDKSYINFSSNDYLGLAADTRLVEAMINALNTQGVGSGASHLTAGHHRAHHQLEEALAEFTGREKALVFSSGYMANLGVITALMGKDGAIFQDKLNHASLLDAAKLSDAASRRFPHLDYAALDRMLSASSSQQRLVVSDGVFSMDGDRVDGRRLADLCQQHKAWLMLDDAHGFGVLGEQGAGCAELEGLNQQQLPILVGTLGKAFGTSGAFVAGSAVLIDTLVQFSRTYIYTTAMPPAIAQATLTSLTIVQSESWRREKLNTLIAKFRQGCESLGIPLMHSTTPIQPILVGESELAVSLSEALKEAGFWITAIRPPTVPLGMARLRVTLTVSHTEAQVEHLLNVLADQWSHLNAQN